MADFFEKLKNDIEKGWDDIKNSFKETAYDLGEEERRNLQEEGALYAWADGDLKSYPYLSELASTKDQIMKTLAVMMIKDDELVSPANGVVAGIAQEDNSIAIALNEDLIVAVKVCTSCADFSKDAQILVKKGQAVKKGEPLVKFNKTLEAKSKLLLVIPETTAAFAQMGFTKTNGETSVKKGDQIIGK